MAPASPLASSFPSVRRGCHPSLGLRQGYNSTVWVLATDTVTWTADKTQLPRPRKPEALLSHKGLVFCLSYWWSWINSSCTVQYSKWAFSIFQGAEGFGGLMWANLLLTWQSSYSNAGLCNAPTHGAQRRCWCFLYTEFTTAAKLCDTKRLSALPEPRGSDNCGHYQSIRLCFINFRYLSSLFKYTHLQVDCFTVAASTDMTKHLPPRREGMNKKKHVGLCLES